MLSYYVFCFSRASILLRSSLLGSWPWNPTNISPLTGSILHHQLPLLWLILSIHHLFFFCTFSSDNTKNMQFYCCLVVHQWLQVCECVCMQGTRTDFYLWCFNLSFIMGFVSLIKPALLWCCSHRWVSLMVSKKAENIFSHSLPPSLSRVRSILQLTSNLWVRVKKRVLWHRPGVSSHTHTLTCTHVPTRAHTPTPAHTRGRSSSCLCNWW